MKKLTVLTLLLGAPLLALLGATTARADWSPNAVTGENITLAKGQEHRGAYYAAGSTVKIEGNVDGDVYCAGETIEITGSVSGSVLCAGKSIRIAGAVGRDIRAAAQTVTIDSKVSGSVSAFAQTITVSQSSAITGELNGAAQTVRIEGSVGQNVRMGAEDIVIGAPIAGNVDVGVGSLLINDNGKVAGNVNYTAEKQLQLSQDKVSGKISYNQPPESAKPSPADTFMSILMVGLSLFVSAMLLAVFFPRFFQRSATIAQQNIGLTALIGLAVVFSVPFIILLLAISMVAIPLALLLLLVWICTLAVSGMFFAYWIGSLVLRSSNNILVRMAAGSAIVLVLYAIPYIGGLAIFIALIMGSGIAVRTISHGHQSPAYQVAPVLPPAHKNTRTKSEK